MSRARMSVVPTSVIVIVVVFAAAALVAAGRDVPQRDADWVAPADAASKVNPLANRPAAEAGGHKLFSRRCSTCHGDDGRGTSKGPDLAATDVQAQTDGELFWKISSGNTRTGMPTFSFLPDSQRWQLVLHLRALPR